MSEENSRDEDQILDLAALAPERKQVRFTEDGDLYEIALPAELSLQQRAEVSGYARRGERLADKQNPDADDLRRLKRELDKAFKIVVPNVPDDVIEDLSDWHKESVVLAFMSAFGDALRALAKAAGGEETESALQSMSGI